MKRFLPGAFALLVPLLLASRSQAQIVVPQFCIPSTNPTLQARPDSVISHDTLEFRFCPDSVTASTKYVQFQVAVDSLFQYKVWQDTTPVVSSSRSWRAYLPLGTSYFWRARMLYKVAGKLVSGPWTTTKRKVTKSIGAPGCKLWGEGVVEPPAVRTFTTTVLTPSEGRTFEFGAPNTLILCKNFIAPLPYDTTKPWSLESKIWHDSFSLSTSIMSLSLKTPGGVFTNDLILERPPYLDALLDGFGGDPATPFGFYVHFPLRTDSVGAWTYSVGVGAWAGLDYKWYSTTSERTYKVLAPECPSDNLYAFPLAPRKTETVDASGKVVFQFCPSRMYGACPGNDYNVQVVDPDGDTLRYNAAPTNDLGKKNDTVSIALRKNGFHEWRIRRRCGSPGGETFDPWSSMALFEASGVPSVGIDPLRSGATGRDLPWTAEIRDLSGRLLWNGGSDLPWASERAGVLRRLSAHRTLVVRLRTSATSWTELASPR